MAKRGSKRTREEASTSKARTKTAKSTEIREEQQDHTVETNENPFAHLAVRILGFFL